jgi:hypothetical protein
MRLLVVFAALCALVPPVYAKTLGPIQMHSGWVTFKSTEERNGFKIFRRYAYIGETVAGEAEDASPFPNLIMFNCSKDVRRAASHLTIVLPKGFEPDSFPRITWLQKTTVRLLIDGHLSVEMPTECRDGEFYFDLTTETQESFGKAMLADTLAIGFGAQNDVVEFQFTEKIDGFFSEGIREVGSPWGTMKHYTRAGPGSVTEACSQYQRAR